MRRLLLKWQNLLTRVHRTHASTDTKAQTRTHTHTCTYTDAALWLKRCSCLSKIVLPLFSLTICRCGVKWQWLLCFLSHSIAVQTSKKASAFCCTWRCNTSRPCRSSTFRSWWTTAGWCCRTCSRTTKGRYVWIRLRTVLYYSNAVLLCAVQGTWLLFVCIDTLLPDGAAGHAHRRWRGGAFEVGCLCNINIWWRFRITL